MINVIDLIETSDVGAVQGAWEITAKLFASLPGFRSAQLMRTFDTVHPQAEYALTSVCQWDSDADWQRARAVAKSDADIAHRLSKLPAKFTGFKGKLVQGLGFSPQPASNQNTVVVDVIQLPESRADGYAKMWARAKEFMQPKPGYVGASLFRSIDEQGAIRFVNLAEWKSTELFFGGLKTPEFFAIVEDYKADFALYLSRRQTLVSVANGKAAQLGAAV